MVLPLEFGFVRLLDWICGGFDLYNHRLFGCRGLFFACLCHRASCLLQGKAGGRRKRLAQKQELAPFFPQEIDAKEQTNGVNRTTMKELVLDF